MSAPPSPVDRIKRMQRDNDRQWGRTGIQGPRAAPSVAARVPAAQAPQANAFVGALGIQPTIVFTNAAGTVDISNNGTGTSRIVVYKGGADHTLDTINGHVTAGQLLFVHGAADEVLVRHNVGNIITANQGHVTAHVGDILMFMFLTTDFKWHQINTTPEQAAGIAADGVSSEQLRYRLQYKGNVSGHQSPDVNVPSGYRGYYWDVTGDFGMAFYQAELIDQAAEFIICIRQDSAGGRSLTDIGASITNATAEEVDSLINKAPGAETAFRFVTFGNYDWHVESISIGSVSGGGDDLTFASLTGHIDPVNQIQDDSIPGSKIQEIGADQLTGADAVGCVPISGGIIVEGGTSTPVDGTWGEISAIKGQLPVTRLDSTGAAMGQVIRRTNNSEEWAYLGLADLGDVAPVSPTVPNVLVYDTESGTTQWRPALISDRYVDSIGIGKLAWAGTSADINHLAQLNPDGTVSAGTISTVAGSLDTGRINHAGAENGDVLVINSGDPEWSGLRLGDLGDVESTTPLNGQLLRRTANQWGAGKLTDDYITDRTINVNKLAASTAGKVLVAGQTANYWGDLSNAASGLPVDHLTLPSTAEPGDFVRVDTNSQGDLEIGLAPVNVSDLGDFEPVSAVEDKVMVRKRVNSQLVWGPDSLNKDHFAQQASQKGHVLGYESVRGDLDYLTLASIAGSIGPSKISSAGANTGDILTRTAGGTAWAAPEVEAVIDHLADIGDVADGIPLENTMLAYLSAPGGAKWTAITSLPTDFVVPASAINGDIAMGNMPALVEGAFDGYDSAQGTLEVRLGAAATGGGAQSSTDLDDFANTAPTESYQVPVWSASQETYVPAKIPTTAIVDGAITGGKIADSTITGGKIADSTISNSKIISIDGSKVGGTNSIGISALPLKVFTALSDYPTTIPPGATVAPSVDDRLDILEARGFIPSVITATSDKVTVAADLELTSNHDLTVKDDLVVEDNATIRGDIAIGSTTGNDDDSDFRHRSPAGRVGFYGANAVTRQTVNMLDITNPVPISTNAFFIAISARNRLNQLISALDELGLINGSGVQA